mmetsp:Transcript_11088/g.20575  ORF Transcript_11088/g.20575 Transcript_11088/m.20575 type:complete len:293 (-) Transcript_11088:87-965(-)
MAVNAVMPRLKVPRPICVRQPFPPGWRFDKWLLDIVFVGTEVFEFFIPVFNGPAGVSAQCECQVSRSEAMRVLGECFGFRSEYSELQDGDGHLIRVWKPDGWEIPNVVDLTPYISQPYYIENRARNQREYRDRKRHENSLIKACYEVAADSDYALLLPLLKDRRAHVEQTIRKDERAQSLVLRIETLAGCWGLESKSSKTGKLIKIQIWKSDTWEFPAQVDFTPYTTLPALPSRRKRETPAQRAAKKARKARERDNMVVKFACRDCGEHTFARVKDVDRGEECCAYCYGELW